MKIHYKFWLSIEFTDNTKFEDVVDINTLQRIIENTTIPKIKRLSYYNINLKIKNNGNK